MRVDNFIFVEMFTSAFHYVKRCLLCIGRNCQLLLLFKLSLALKKGKSKCNIFFALAFSVVGFLVVGKSRCQGLPQATSEAGDKRSEVVLDSISDADRLHSNSNRKASLLNILFVSRNRCLILTFLYAHSQLEGFQIFS